MEQLKSRRLLIAIGLVLFFGVVVMVWYFFYAKPVIAPSITKTNDNPLGITTNPPRFQFLKNWGSAPDATSTTEVTSKEEKPLIQIWNKPATGQTFVTQSILREEIATSTVGTTTTQVKKMIRATTTVLVFVDTTTGYIYGYQIESKQIFQISNTLIPGVYDAYFFNEAKNIIIRYIDREKNLVRTLSATVSQISENSVPLPLQNQTYLAGKVSSVAINRTKTQASYVVNGGSGSSIYTLSGKGVVKVASSPFSEWDLSYGGDILFATTKPSAYVEGSTARLPNFTIEVAERTGLISNPNDSGEFLNSMWSKSGLLVYISNKKGDTVLPIKTLASKCTWGNSSFLVCALPRTFVGGLEGLPDDWFQGRVTFSDDLYLIDKVTGNKNLLYSFENEVGDFDIPHIEIVSDNTMFSFTRKQDKTLWLLDTTLSGGNFEN